AVFDSIKVKRWRGWFDIFTWNEGHCLFLESKRVAKDRIRFNQRAWLQAALEANLKADSFLIVEWHL
ncbi:MAG TPA: hypothetical protein VJV74_12130, partial [Terriglobia bacterium]|nr:hypothetical protein [Terriglobia bacterium]